ncbi:hypothetical protein [Halalkalibacter krulwichiae]|uniref:Uncharacterized protein n=1 Tax=Halalkalibacter krulwichiae TaxID=199441 RepID=A0A1X9MGT7_9BACI|nr:hypothetical protein [Halalkalibacter krulwichiae]ARK32646.1 hypothetical protein BkAM31D_23880 [Halalkalibacter krulwichiae]
MVVNEKSRLQKVGSLFLHKVAGAGFSITILFIISFLITGRELYEFVETISHWSLWLLFFGYGVICSIVIDFLCSNVFKRDLKVLLYILAGYGCFLIFGLNYVTIIAGTVGALCALIFYGGLTLAERSKAFTYLCAFVLPILFLALIQFDFTEKKQWEAVQTDSSFHATFHYFNGRHHIPIAVEDGKTVQFQVKFTVENGASHGYHVRDEAGDLVGMTETSEDSQLINVEDPGIYHIVVTGRHLEGSVQVDWEIVEAFREGQNRHKHRAGTNSDK